LSRNSFGDINSTALLSHLLPHIFLLFPVNRRISTNFNLENGEAKGPGGVNFKQM